MRFLDLKISAKVPDNITIWKFWETHLEEGVIEAVFYRFNALLDQHILLAQTGQIVDANFVEAPRQRNSREKNSLIKAGKTTEAWKEYPYKLRQKDIDARWVKNNNIT